LASQVNQLKGNLENPGVFSRENNAKEFTEKIAVLEEKVIQLQERKANETQLTEKYNNEIKKNIILRKELADLRKENEDKKYATELEKKKVSSLMSKISQLETRKVEMKKKTDDYKKNIVILEQEIKKYRKNEIHNTELTGKSTIEIVKNEVLRQNMDDIQKILYEKKRF